MESHACELCGKILSDDTLVEHTRSHLASSGTTNENQEESNQPCPFCGVTLSSTELLLHVNQQHLDFLTPTSQNGTTTSSDGLHFIDEQQTPSSYYSVDSDSMSDYRLSPDLSTATVVQQPTKNSQHHTNGATMNGGASTGAYAKKTEVNGKHPPATTATTTAVNHHEINGDVAKEILNNPGKQGSPLRNKLGLKLKVHKPVQNKVSPLLCPLCPYTTDIDAATLEQHINRSHFDPLSPGLPSSNGTNNHLHNMDTLNAFACPICSKTFESAGAVELHVNIEHRDILSPAKVDINAEQDMNGAAGGSFSGGGGGGGSRCPVCGISLDNMSTGQMELHIENHFSKTPIISAENDAEKQAQKIREQREFDMLRAQYGMDCQGNFREQSTTAMQRAVYAGEMSVADYYERQVGLKAAETHGVDDGLSCTRSIAPRVSNLSSPGVIRSFVCSAVDHYASSYGDKGWGCGYRNLQMLLSSLLQNTLYNEAIYSAWGQHGPSRTAMPSISRLQKMVEGAWAQGFDVQGADQLGMLHNTRKWIGATEIVTVLSWLRIDCQLVDFHRPTSPDGRHPDLFNWVLKYFEEPRSHSAPLYLQHQGHSRTIIGIEQRSSGLTLLILDPSHGPKQVAALGTQESLRLIRRGAASMRAPQYQIVAVRGLLDTEEQYQSRKVLKSLRIPPDR